MDRRLAAPVVEPLLFRLPGLVLGLAALGLGAWQGQVLLTLLAALMVAGGLSAWAWSRWSVRSLELRRELTPARAFAGEQVELSLTLANRKLLPLAWVEVSDSLPEELVGPEDDLDPGLIPGRRHLVRTTSLLWYQQARFRCTLKCSRRGCYGLGPAWITSGDVFGLYPRTVPGPAGQELLVYPRLIPLPRWGLASRYPIGEALADTFLFEDPTRPAGLRPYTPGTPLKRIHFKASARHGKLMAKIYEPTTTLRLAILVEVESFAPAGPEDAAAGEQYELALSLAASLAEEMLRLRHPVGLFINAAQAGGGAQAALAPAGGPGQISAVLEALARAGDRPSGEFPDLLDQAAARLVWGTSLAVITRGPEPRVLDRLGRLKAAGFPVTFLMVGDSPSPAGNWRCHRVGGWPRGGEAAA